MSATLIAGALVVLGLVGVVVPGLPGSPLVGAGVLVWALDERTAAAWVVLGCAVAVLTAGQVGSWLLAGRSVARSGVPRTSLAVAAAAALGGLFVIPVAGAVAGGVLGLYLAELARLGPGPASARSTLTALWALALQLGVEFAAALTAAAAWLVAAVVTA